MERCCCGNRLRDTPVTINVAPCRCEKPGKEKLHVGTDTPEGMLENLRLTPTELAKRERLGLSRVTDMERGSYHKWS